jgi:hypothetical protein
MPLKSALFAVGMVTVAGVAPAQPKEFKPPGPQVAPALDRIAMTAFVCEPSPIPPGTTQVTLRVTIKNVTGGLQGVTLGALKIRVFRTNPQPDVLELETTVGSLAPGASQTVGARVNVGPGLREYFARVDPDDVLHEPIVQRANNESRLKLTIPQASGQQAPPPGSAPPLATQDLDYERAKQAGAQFAHGVEGSQGICVNVGQFNANLSGWVVAHSIPAGVVFSMDCAPGGLAVPTGAKATPSAFRNFRLKNGWKVKEFSFGDVLREAADWQWRKTPSKGTDDPSMEMHIWANPGGRLAVPIRVSIEGPAGTNPYM